jgi:hypothetical protein
MYKEEVRKTEREKKGKMKKRKVKRKERYRNITTYDVTF